MCIFSELSRAYLCSTVLVLDLLIVMQDWDFPHFTNTLDVNLPGFHKHIINIDTVEIQISGKWFNYGIIFLVMIFDLNMWKNQIFYYPEKYGQYIGEFSNIFCMFLNPNTFYPIWIPRVLIYYTWETFRNKLKKHSVKVRIFWEGHKILKNLPLKFWRYWVASN